MLLGEVAGLKRVVAEQREAVARLKGMERGTTPKSLQRGKRGRSGDNQLAHQSMISRRFMIVPPALPNSGHAEQLGKQARSCQAYYLTWRT